MLVRRTSSCPRSCSAIVLLIFSICCFCLIVFGSMHCTVEYGYWGRQYYLALCAEHAVGETSNKRRTEKDGIR